MVNINEKKQISKQIKSQASKKTRFVINDSFRHAVLCGQNWIAIIAISKNENIKRKENWTEMAWKLQPLIHSEECFFFFEASS